MKIKRHKQTVTVLLSDGQYLKLRLLPWRKTGRQCLWLVSLAISKSKRQINDWLDKRKNKRSCRLSNKLTGRVGSLTQFIAVRQLRKWVNVIPRGDSITFICESCVSDKQFKVWQKWFARREDKDWIINEEFKYFLYCT